MDDKIVMALGAGTIIYVFFTVLIVVFFNQILTLPIDPLGGEGFAHQLWNLWLTIGALLGVSDALAVLGFFAGTFSGW